MATVSRASHSVIVEPVTRHQHLMEWSGSGGLSPFPRFRVTGLTGMLLYLSGGGDRVRCGEGAEQLPGDVALERSHDLLRGAAFGSSARDVSAGGRIDVHADDGDRRERSVQASVTAAVESMPHGVARGGWGRTGPGQRGHRGLGAHSPGARPSNEHAGRNDSADAGQLEQLRGPG